VSGARGGVVFVILRHAGSQVYGGDYSTVMTARALERRGVRCHFVLTFRDQLAAELDRAGLSYEVIEIPHPFDGLRAAPLGEKLQRIRNVARVANAVRAAVKRIGARRVDAAGIQSFVPAWAGARAAGAGTIFHVRGASRGSRTTGLEELAMLLASATVAVSPSLRDQLVGTGRRWLRPLLRDRVTVVYNGFDFHAIDDVRASITQAEARARVGLDPDRPSLLMVGSFWTDKGQARVIEDVLPRVVAEVPDVHATFIGGENEPGYRARCEESARRLGLARNVTILDYKPLGEVYLYFVACDLVVMASHREGLPRSAIEAQAFGRPVVATSVVGLPDAVLHGRTGYLVPNDRVEDLAPLIVKLARDPALRRELGEAGARHVRETFTVERNAAEMSRLLGVDGVSRAASS
jgi:glycosyltransferase involved in cell wall biosynthesis